MAKRRRNRSAVLATSLLASACGGSAAPARPPVTVSDPAPAPAPTPAASTDRSDEAIAALATDAVSDQQFARRTLYSWTTAAQIAELATTDRLLLRAESPEHGASYWDVVVHALAARGDPIARLLDREGYAKARYAWPAAWATLLGPPGETYGDQLIRVTLKQDAIIVAFSTVTGVFEARDLDDRPVTAEQLFAGPERIAAIYFISDLTAPPAAGVPQPATTYREYIVCNESMIESWSVGDPEVAGELAREAAMLERVAKAIPRPLAMPVVGEVWRSPAAAAGIGHAFAMTLAFESPSYQPLPGYLVDLARRLRALHPATRLTRIGTATFPGTGAVRKPPRIVAPRARGTYGTRAGGARPRPRSTFARPAKP